MNYHEEHREDLERKIKHVLDRALSTERELRASYEAQLDALLNYYEKTFGVAYPLSKNFPLVNFDKQMKNSSHYPTQLNMLDEMKSRKDLGIGR